MITRSLVAAAGFSAACAAFSGSASAVSFYFAGGGYNSLDFSSIILGLTGKYLKQGTDTYVIAQVYVPSNQLETQCFNPAGNQGEGHAIDEPKTAIGVSGVLTENDSISKKGDRTKGTTYQKGVDVNINDEANDLRRFYFVDSITGEPITDTDGNYVPVNNCWDANSPNRDWLQAFWQFPRTLYNQNGDPIGIKDCSPEMYCFNKFAVIEYDYDISGNLYPYLKYAGNKGERVTAEAIDPDMNNLHLRYLNWTYTWLPKEWWVKGELLTQPSLTDPVETLSTVYQRCSFDDNNREGAIYPGEAYSLLNPPVRPAADGSYIYGFGQPASPIDYRAQFTCESPVSEDNLKSNYPAVWQFFNPQPPAN